MKSETSEHVGNKARGSGFDAGEIFTLFFLFGRNLCVLGRG